MENISTFCAFQIDQLLILVLTFSFKIIIAKKLLAEKKKSDSLGSSQ